MENFYLKSSKVIISRARGLRREMTKAERRLWTLLRHSQLKVHFRRQVPFGPYILDFACLEPKIVVELDGTQHLNEKTAIYDSKRDSYLKEQGFKVLRISDRDLLANSDGVVKVIYEHIQKVDENA